MIKQLLNLQPLRLQALWLCLSVVLLSTFLYLSLVRVNLPNMGVSHVDKWLHFLAYFCLTAWYCQLVVGFKGKWLVGLALLILGVGVEFAQSLTSYRAAELQDVLANAVGIAAALLLCSTVFGRALLMIERVIFSLFGRR